MTPAQAPIQRVMAPGTCTPGRPARRPEPLGEFGQRGHPQAVGDQFDRQRKPARLAADAARQHQLAGPVRHRHPRHGGPGQEQRHRLRRNRMAGLAGNSHGLHPPHAFGLDVERDAARHQNAQIRGPPGQLLAGATGRLQHVLAVVDDQQRPAARHRPGHGVKSRRGLGPPDPHRLDQGRDHLLIGTAWHQVGKARQLRPASRHLDPPRLDRQRGLPDPPDAGQRHHRMPGQPGRDLAEVRCSPHKGRPSRRQPHRRTVRAGIAGPDGELAKDLPHQPTVTPRPRNNQGETGAAASGDLAAARRHLAPTG